MGFEAAVRTVLNKYLVVDGRAGRSEYWYWVLFVVLVSIALDIVGRIVDPLMILSGLFALATFIPGITVGVRRLHDIGKSGWTLLFGLIPILGWIYLIYLAVQPSQPGTNQYGPEPSGTVTATA